MFPDDTMTIAKESVPGVASAVSDIPTPLTTSSQPNSDLAKRIAELSPEQRALFLDKLRQKAPLYEVISPTVKQENGQAEGYVDLAQESALDPSIQPLSVPGQFVTTSSQIFLTGGTGFLGAFLIEELLRQTDAVIHCLVRANSLEDGQRRLQRNLEWYEIWQPSFSNRIIPVLGDLSSPKFGLSDLAFEDLATEIDTIYHCAASLNFVFPYSALKAMNVSATEDILRLASSVKRKTVHYMSSISVFESEWYAARTVSESDLLEHPEGMFLGYAQSKWAAEKLVLNARDRGLPVCIYRLPFISGHSQTGAWNTNDFTCLLIKGTVAMGTAPELDYMMTLSPVDYASRSIVYLAQQPASENQVFHLMNPNPVPNLEVNQWSRRLGSLVQYLSYKEWQADFKKKVTSTDHPLFSLRSFFLEPYTEERLSIPEFYTRSRSAAYDCTATLKALEGSTIRCHPVSPELFETYLDYFLRKGMLDEKDFNPTVLKQFKTKFRVQQVVKNLVGAIAHFKQGFNFTEWRRINISHQTD
jgi:thioester reductase-like protein